MAEQQIPPLWIERAVAVLYSIVKDHEEIIQDYKDRRLDDYVQKRIERVATALWQSDTKAKEARDEALEEAGRWLDLHAMPGAANSIRSLKTPPPTTNTSL